MKRILLISLLLVCLIACSKENPTDIIGSTSTKPTTALVTMSNDCDAITPEVKTIEVTVTQTPVVTFNPLNVVVNPDSLLNLGIEMEVTDGEQYGCDVVCWFDGFGYCYNVEDGKAASYEIQLSSKMSAPETFSNEYFPYFENDSTNYINSGYGVYLTTETRSYKIGHLQMLNRHHRFGYGTFFNMLTEEDPQVELLPVEPQFDNLWGDDAAWFEKVLEDSNILMYPTKFEFCDSGFEEVDIAQGDPCLVEITDETLTMICFFDCQRPGMLVTRERMLKLVQDGYFMKYPCWAYVSDGKLVVAMQINSFQTIMAEC